MEHKLTRGIVAFISVLIIVAAIAIMGYFFIFGDLFPVNKEKTEPVQKREVNALTLYHWWTSPGESAAIQSLITVFTKKYPDVAIVAAPVTGGAGFTMLPIVKTLVENGEAPDAFQMHAGYEAKPYLDAGLLDPIDYIWGSENLEQAIPKVIRDMLQFNGHYYAVPVDVHRVNVVWYNKKILSAHNINPDNITTWDDFFAACEKLRTAGVSYPVALGPTWTAAHAFEQILASQGIEFYEDFINGKISSADDQRLIKAFSTFERYITFANPDHATLREWDVANKRIINGESAFSIMGDWANAEFKLVGMTYGNEYGSFPVPGTNNMYGLSIDTFQHPKGVSHPTNSDRWLREVVSVEGQDTFNPIKGSIAARSDSDVTKYEGYQRLAIADFNSVRYMFPSIVHGSGGPSSLRLKLNEVAGIFSADPDVSFAAGSLADNFTKTIFEYTKTWSLR